MKNWYVIQTKHSKEQDVTTLLQKADFEVFFPQYKEVFYRKGSAPFFKVSSLFPRYLFVHSNFSCVENFYKIKYTRGVSKILCADSKPVAILPSIISTIQNKTKNGVLEIDKNFKKGDLVKVKKGALKDLIGILEKPISPEGRVAVLLNLINYKMKANLHWTELQKLQAA